MLSSCTRRLTASHSPIFPRPASSADDVIITVSLYYLPARRGGGASGAGHRRERHRAGNYGQSDVRRRPARIPGRSARQLTPPTGVSVSRAAAAGDGGCGGRADGGVISERWMDGAVVPNWLTLGGRSTATRRGGTHGDW